MKKITLLCVLLAMSGCELYGQNINTANGYIVGHPYQNYKIDSVDLASGGLSLKIPIRAFKEQDPVTISYDLTYAGKHFSVGEYTLNGVYFYGWMWSDPLVFNSPSYLDPPDVPTYAGVRLGNNQDWRRTTTPQSVEAFPIAVTPDGSRHIFAKDVNYVWRSTDASGLMIPYGNAGDAANPLDVNAVIDRSGVAHTAWYENSITGTSAGTPLTRNRGLTAATVNFDAVDSKPKSITDAKGLTLPWADPNTGHLGTPLTDLSVCQGARTTSSGFRVDFPGSSNTVPARPPQTSSSNVATYYFCYAAIPIKTNFLDPDVFNTPHRQEFEQTMQLLQSVVLPNGTAWKFEYDDRDPGDDPSINYAELTKVTFPTGGSIAYTYTSMTPCLREPDGTYTSRYIKTRIETVDGVSSQWSYAYTPLTDDGVIADFVLPYVTVTSPVGKEIHTFADADDCVGYEVSVQAQDLSGNVLATTKEQPFPVGRPIYSENVGYVGGEPEYLPGTVSNVLADGTASLTTYQYDYQLEGLHSPLFVTTGSGPGYWAQHFPLSFADLIDKKTYDFGASSPTAPYTQGALLSETQTSYEYATNSDAFEANAIDAVHEMSVYGSSGLLKKIDTSYDTKTYFLDTFQYKFITPNTITGYDAATGQSYPITQTYDGHGLLLSTTNAQHSTTSVGRDSSNIYVTSTTRPSTNGISHVSYTTYDKNTDHIVASVDENGSTATDVAHMVSYSYDNMMRNTSVVYPATSAGQSSTTLCYVDTASSSCPDGGTPNSIYLVTKASPSPDIHVSITLDGFARSSSSTAMSAHGPILMKTEYDSMGRVISTTNPYTSQSDLTYGKTLTQYDALNRVMDEKKVDGAGTVLADVSRQYNSYPLIDSYDANGKHSKQKVDALGQIKKVFEPDVSNNPTLETDYGYDALGHVISVVQYGNTATETPRTRSFVYNNYVSKVIASFNPEMGSSSTTCTGTSSPWSICYTYDGDGNVTSRTDARGVQASYAYDALDRLASKSYSSDPSSTPTSCYRYDDIPGNSAAHYVGGLAVEWTQSGSCSSSGLPPSTGTLSTRQTDYDAVGRVASITTCVLKGCNTSTPHSYSSTYGYDLAGNLLQYSNYSAVISNHYDEMGRLQQITSSRLDPAQSPFLYTVNEFSPAGPAAIDIGAAMSRIRTYDPLMRPTSDTTTRK